MLALRSISQNSTASWGCKSSASILPADLDACTKLSKHPQVGSTRRRLGNGLFRGRQASDANEAGVEQCRGSCRVLPAALS